MIINEHALKIVNMNAFTDIKRFPLSKYFKHENNIQHNYLITQDYLFFKTFCDQIYNAVFSNDISDNSA